MEQLTGSIIEGFTMLRQVMLQPYGMPQQYTAPQPVYLDPYNRVAQHQQSATQPPRSTAADAGNGDFQFAHYSQMKDFETVGHMLVCDILARPLSNIKLNL